MSLFQKVDQVAHNTAVATIEESSGDTSVTGTTGTTNSVNIVVDIGGQVIVDDVGNIRNIETTGGNSSGNQNWATSATEELQSAFTLALSAVTMDGGCREALVDEEVGQRISHALGLDKNEGKTAGSVGVEDIQEDRTLVMVLDILDLLSDVLRRRPNATNGQENVVFQKIAGKHLDITRKSGGEHECLAVIHRGHILTLDNTANLGFETHVQHAVSLIKNQVFDVNKGDTATFDKVNQTTRSSDQHITAALDLAQLRANIGTSVHDTWTNPGAIGELAGLVKDLRDKLASRGKDQGSRVSLALPAIAQLTLSRCRGSRRPVLIRLGKDREQETTGLSRTSLCACHEVTTIHDNGNRILLNRGGDFIAGELNVREQMVIQRRVREGVNGFGDVVTGGLHGDIIIVGKVDASSLLGGVIGNTEKFALQTGVRGTGDMFAIAPLTVSRASGSTGGTALGATVTWVSVSIWVEGPAWTIRGTPVRVTIGGIARVERRGICPAATTGASSAARNYYCS